ncbi:hypothetical protein HDU98_000739, partial [Podochytrium sp. JEL0797]
MGQLLSDLCPPPPPPIQPESDLRLASLNKALKQDFYAIVPAELDAEIIFKRDCEYSIDRSVRKAIVSQRIHSSQVVESIFKLRRPPHFGSPTVYWAAHFLRRGIPEASLKKAL